MKCPYQNFGCTEVNTSGMTKIECEDCHYYDKGIRLTGATPILGYIINIFNQWTGYKAKNFRQ